MGVGPGDCTETVANAIRLIQISDVDETLAVDLVVGWLDDWCPTLARATDVIRHFDSVSADPSPTISNNRSAFVVGLTPDRI